MNYITQKHLQRRAFLRGVGATLALPMLDAMMPAFARGSVGKAPTRMAFSYVPNGIIMKDFTPSGTGAAFEFTKTLKPLDGVRKNVMVLSGLKHHNADAIDDGPGDHARAGACFLTGVHPKKTSGADIRSGVSVDQIAAAANEVGGATRFPSLELGCEDSRTVGNCDSGYSCAYTNSISWRTPTTPMPPETNPRAVFERLFGTDANLDPATRAKRQRARSSILDLVSERTQSLSSNLGASDKRKLDEYLYAVREIEKRIEMAETNKNVEPNMEEPAGVPVTFGEYARLMYDLQALALQTDLTRVSTMVLAREGSVRTYGEIGVADPHHPLSHHRNNPDAIEKLSQINRFHMELFAYFIKKLDSTPDGDGTLLDHSMVVYGSAISDGNQHTHDHLPVILAGGGNGCLSGGRHIVYKDTPMTNLYLTMLGHLGVPIETIGDSTGALSLVTDLT